MDQKDVQHNCWRQEMIGKNIRYYDLEIKSHFWYIYFICRSCYVNLDYLFSKNLYETIWHVECLILVC